MLKKIRTIFLVLVMIFSIIPIKSNAIEKEYQGYSEEIKIFQEEDTGIRIKDGIGLDGKDNIAYCYDKKAKYPSSIDEKDKMCFYSRIENYLSSDDGYINAYGKEKKQKVALALYVGYPNDAYGDYKNGFKGKISCDEARYITQNLVWDITQGYNLDYYPNQTDLSKEMCNYYNKLKQKYISSFKEGTEFFPSDISINGNIKATNKNNMWEIGPLSLKGIKGAFFNASILTSDDEMKIYHYETNKEITELSPLESGEKFIIRTPNDPKESTIGIDWQCESVKFYFYKYLRGSNENSVQNLIRVQPIKRDGTIWFSFDTDGNGEKYKNEKIKISLKKIWEGNNENEKLPEVYIKVLSGEKIIALCNLRKENNWVKSIEIPKDIYDKGIKIEEIKIDGYSPSVKKDGDNKFIITNKKEPEKPVVPEPKPEKPEKPVVPTPEPEKPEKPVVPTPEPEKPKEKNTSKITKNPKEEVSISNHKNVDLNKNTKKEKVPKTGDTSQIPIFILIFIISTIIFIII